jgi:DNA-binding NarL/FixJ family response regulator
MGAMANPLTVIIADDDAEDRQFLKQCLDASTRLRVIAELANGAEALHYVSGTGLYQDRARHPLPDLLIIDAVMPAFDAKEILDWLAAHPAPGMKVVVFSGYPVSDVRERYLQRGAHAFFYKTGEMQQLASIAKEIETGLIAGGYDRAKPAR